MAIDQVRLAMRSGRIVESLTEDGSAFLVDWRHEDEAIPDLCERVLRTGELSGELVELSGPPGYEVFIRLQNARSKVPLTYSPGDRHVTLCALNRLLAPLFEIRYVVESHRNDTGCFVPLPCADWRTLEQEFGAELRKHFYVIQDRPNIFTELTKEQLERSG